MTTKGGLPPHLWTVTAIKQWHSPTSAPPYSHSTGRHYQLLNSFTMTASNTIHLIGRVGGDVQTKTFDNGTVLAEFSLATNEYFRDRENNKQERTHWHRIKAYGKRAETLAKYLKKGSKVSITGSLGYRKWTDKFDQPRVSSEVSVQAFQFLGGSGKSSAEQGGRSAAMTPPGYDASLEALDR